ncbi:MAG: nucleoside triphosphate pyrophosphohydrolase [Candidatus Liptonbacteria bacterium]|nr:nucleoside triphosphate pyrophosphohydrolase [Candidatus Liptonbacteria bacterium]
MKYNKLVRDKIPKYIKNKSGKPVTHIAGDAEYWERLKEKLLEEATEFNKEESIEELADILEVIDAISDYKKFNKREIENAKSKKAEEKGKFEKRIILDES